MYMRISFQMKVSLEIAGENEGPREPGKRVTHSVCFPKLFLIFGIFSSLLLKSGNNTSYIGVTFAWDVLIFVGGSQNVDSPSSLRIFPLIFYGFFFLFSPRHSYLIYTLFSVFYGCLFIERLPPFWAAAPQGLMTYGITISVFFSFFLSFFLRPPDPSDSLLAPSK